MSKLKTKLALLFLVLAFAPLATIGAFSLNTTQNIIENLVLRQLESVAADKAGLLERWLEERRADLQVIAGTSILKSMDPAAISPYLELIQNHYGVYKDITVISAGKETIVSSRGGEFAFDDDRWDWANSRKEMLLSNITLLPEEKESAFHIAAPIIEGDRLIGTVFGTVGTSRIINFILQVSLGKTGECYLVDKNGTFLAHKEPRRILAENISQSGSFRNIFGNRDVKKAYLDYRNIEVLGISKKVGGTDWYLVVEQDRDEAFKNVDTLKRYIFFTILLAIGCTLVLTWGISHHIVMPIRNLSRSAGSLASERLDPSTIQTSRQDEIGVLCRAFSEMAETVQARQDDLEKKFNLKEAELKETDLTLKQFKLIAERSEKFAALGRLGAAVAHEIRTPLTSLKLFLQSIQAEIEISPEYKEDFSIAMGQTARIEAAINRFLDFTKPKDLVFSDVSVSEIITDVVSMVKPLANKQECALRILMEENLPSIRADEKLMEEALINLFVNSLEAMTGKGTVTVTLAMEICDSIGAGKECIRIDIADEGSGIAGEYIDQIFDPFFTTKSSGTGLGLPMVLHTIKRHDGEIRVKSHVESGTVFSIFLPTTSLRN